MCNNFTPGNIQDNFYRFANDEHKEKKHKTGDGVEQQSGSEHPFGFLQQCIAHDDEK